jgi:hypothetical protein
MRLAFALLLFLLAAVAGAIAVDFAADAARSPAGVEQDVRLFAACCYGGTALVLAWALTWPAQYLLARTYPRKGASCSDAS